MAELKTTRTGASVAAFLKRAAPGERGKDCAALSRMMAKATRSRAAMWGPAVVGFGTCHYGADGGREWFLAGFSPRKAALTVYLMGGVRRHPNLLKGLGPHKVGGGCLYIKRMADVDQAVLAKLVAASVRDAKKRFPA